MLGWTGWHVIGSLRKVMIVETRHTYEGYGRKRRDGRRYEFRPWRCGVGRKTHVRVKNQEYVFPVCLFVCLLQSATSAL